MIDVTCLVFDFSRARLLMLVPIDSAFKKSKSTLLVQQLAKAERAVSLLSKYMKNDAVCNDTRKSITNLESAAFKMDKDQFYQPKDYPDDSWDESSDAESSECELNLKSFTLPTESKYLRIQKLLESSKNNPNWLQDTEKGLELLKEIIQKLSDYSDYVADLMTHTQGFTVQIPTPNLKLIMEPATLFAVVKCTERAKMMMDN